MEIINIFYLIWKKVYFILRWFPGNLVRFISFQDVRKIFGIYYGGYLLMYFLQDSVKKISNSLLRVLLTFVIGVTIIFILFVVISYYAFNVIRIQDGYGGQ